MLKAVWTLLPADSRGSNYAGEHDAQSSNKWFFDKSVWQRMFRMLAGCEYTSLVLANSHAFPFLLDLDIYQPRVPLARGSLEDYQKMFSWITENALDYEISPYFAFCPGLVPPGITDVPSRDVDTPDLSDESAEYTHFCVRRFLETYPDIAGIIADTGGSADGQMSAYVKGSVVDALDAARPDAQMFVRSFARPGEMFLDAFSRRGGRDVKYLVPYTGASVVDSSHDSLFASWLEAVSAPRVAADFMCQNFDPWTSFSYDTIENIIANLDDLGCDGHVIHPISPASWPRTDDFYFKYQWQRDLVWYSAWGGLGISDMLEEKRPRWIVRNEKLLEGFGASSRVMEVTAMYFSLEDEYIFVPQFCSYISRRDHKMRLMTITDMLEFSKNPGFGKWWKEITGDVATGIDQFLSGQMDEDSFGPEELIDELVDLAEIAVDSGEKGMKNASGEKELPSLSCDAYCMGKMAEFYVQRMEAALAYARGETAESLVHLTASSEIIMEISDIDASHRENVRIIVLNDVYEIDFADMIDLLRLEYDTIKSSGKTDSSDFCLSKKNVAGKK